MRPSIDSSFRLREGVFLVDAEDRVTFCNSRAASLLGWNKGELQGRTLSTLPHERVDPETLRGWIARARAEQREVTDEVSLSDGSERHHHAVRAFTSGEGITTVILEETTATRALAAGLARFVGPSIAAQLRNDSLASWNATRAAMSVVGIAPADFSYFAERLEPPVLRDFLSGYVERVVEVAKAESADVVKLSLPTILLGFGSDQHADRALNTALRLAALGTSLERESVLAGLGAVKIKLALNSGMVVTGPVGCSDRMEFTMLGSSVDAVSSLLDTALAGQTLMTHALLERLGNREPDGVRFLDLGPQRIWGVERPLGIVQVLPVARGRLAT